MFQSMSYTLEDYGSIILTVLNKYYLKLFRRYKGINRRLSWWMCSCIDGRFGGEENGDKGFCAVE
jgi:hypothetical protein